MYCTWCVFVFVSNELLFSCIFSNSFSPHESRYCRRCVANVVSGMLAMSNPNIIIYI